MTPPIPVVRKVTPRDEPRTEAIRTYAAMEAMQRATSEVERRARNDKKAKKAALAGYIAHRAKVAEEDNPEPRKLPDWRFCCAPCGLYHLLPSSEKPMPLLEVDPDA